MSAIEWTDVTWNPVTGCDRVSPGCANCYALELAPRLRKMQRARGVESAWTNAPDGGRASGPAFGVQTLEERLEIPLRWRRPRRVFVNSMSDLFHEEVPFAFIDRVFTTMAQADRHTFQVLTKRPERMLAYFRYAADYMGLVVGDLQPWPNVWLGVSIENRRFVERAEVLRRTPAAVRFVSAEPLLGPLVCPECKGDGSVAPWGGYPGGAACPSGCANGEGSGRETFGVSLDLTGIDWLIVGGESGTRARPMQLRWARDLRDAASESGTRFFVKQLGGRTAGDELGDLPSDLRIREFPRAASGVTA